jgi:hypothetical protein
MKIYSLDGKHCFKISFSDDLLWSDNKPLGSIKEGISCNVIYYHVFKGGSLPGRYEHIASVSID